MSKFEIAATAHAGTLRKSSWVRNIFTRNSSKNRLSEEDLEFLEALEILKEDLAFAHNCLDGITDPILIDGYIYEIQAIHMKYQYYLQRCKEKGLVADMF